MSGGENHGIIAFSECFFILIILAVIIAAGCLIIRQFEDERDLKINSKKRRLILCRFSKPVCILAMSELEMNMKKIVTFFASSFKKALNKCHHWSETKNGSLLFIQEEPSKNPEKRRGKE